MDPGDVLFQLALAWSAAFLVFQTEAVSCMDLKNKKFTSGSAGLKGCFLRNREGTEPLRK